MEEEDELCERRANELEALKAIFAEDIHDLRLVHSALVKLTCKKGTFT